MKDCHPSEEGPKVALLESLYRADGRHEKGHPMHGLYTGLYQAHIASQEQEAA
jgi:hypothetical protein